LAGSLCRLCGPEECVWCSPAAAGATGAKCTISLVLVFCIARGRTLDVGRALQRSLSIRWDPYKS